MFLKKKTGMKFTVIMFIYFNVSNASGAYCISKYTI